MVISRRVLAVTGLVLCGLAVAAAVWLRVSVYRVASGSMEPEFPVGSLVVDSAAVGIEPGRALTFTADGAVVTHVLTGYAPDGSLQTRGTANSSADDWRAPVYPRDVRGRVLFGIPLTAPSFWTSPRGILTALAMGAVVFTLVLWRYARRVEREVTPA